MYVGLKVNTEDKRARLQNPFAFLDSGLRMRMKKIFGAFFTKSTMESGKKNAIGNTGVKNPTQRLGRIASIKEWYRKSEEERAKFVFDKTYEPLEPQDPLGHAYNGILTAATQGTFRRIEFHSRNNPKFVQACNNVASFSHMIISKTALTLIGEPSEFSSPKAYNGVAGIYSLTRFLIPATIAIALHCTTILSEKKEKEKSMSELKNAVGRFENMSSKTTASVLKMEEQIAIMNKKIARMGKTIGENTISMMVMKRGPPYGVSSFEMDDVKKYFVENARQISDDE